MNSHPIAGHLLGRRVSRSHGAHSEAGLLRGAIHTVDLDGRSTYQTRFESYDVTLDLDDTLGAGLRPGDDPPEDLSLGALRARITAAAARGAPAIAERIELSQEEPSQDG